METVSTFGISHFFLLLICALPVEQDSRKVHVNAGDSTTSQTDDYSDLHSTEAQENCSANSESVCDTKSLVALGTGPRLEQPSNKDNKIISSMLSPQGDPRNGHQELGVSSKQKNPSAFKEPVCRLQSDEQSNHYLEVIGAATGYEHGFIEDVVSYNDSHVAKFGVCSSAKQKHRAMPLLRNLAFHIKDDAEMVRLRILHLTEVDWKGYNLQLQYKMSAEGGLLQLIEGSEMALLVFYLGRNQGNFFESGRGLRFSEVHSEEHQTVCFNEETKYIILSIRGNAGKCEEEQLCIDVSLKVRRHSSGARMEREELRQLLFGFDARRFTRMTPALYFLIKDVKDKLSEPSCTSTQDAQSLPPSADEASKVMRRSGSEYLETLDLPSHSPPRHGPLREFLQQLDRFLNVVLDYSTDQNSRSVLHLDKEAIESLPHHSLNISNAHVLELLVHSEEPFVFLLPENAENFLERIKQRGNVGETEEKIHQLFLTKLKNTIRKVLEIPIFRNEEVLKRLIHLLNECNYPFPLPDFPWINIHPQDIQRKMNHRQKIYSTFLLLKTLQTVKTFWEKRQRLFRQNRSATNHSVCKLEELSIDFEHSSYDWILVPKRYNIQNCVGSCRIPLTGNVSNHVVLLIKMQEQGLPTKREPCCVPVEYSELLMAVVSDQSSMITVYKNMVAEECKCR